MKHYVIGLGWAMAALTLTNGNTSWMNIAIGVFCTAMSYRHLKGILYGK